MLVVVVLVVVIFVLFMSALFLCSRRVVLGRCIAVGLSVDGEWLFSLPL